MSDDPSVTPHSCSALSSPTTAKGPFVLHGDVPEMPIPAPQKTLRRRPLTAFSAALLLGALLASACGRAESSGGAQPTGNRATASTPRLSADGEPGAAPSPAAVHSNVPVNEAVTASKSTPTPRDARGKSESFERFWHLFRSAMLEEDLERLAPLTRLPVSVRGTLDDDAVRRVPRLKLGPLVRNLMKQPVAAPGEPQTHEQYLRALELPPPDAVESGGEHARIGDLVFDLEANGWRWTEAYSD